MWTRLHSNTVSNRPTNHVTKAHPTASAEQPFHYIPSETRGLWLSGAEVIDLALLNVSLTFPAVGLMKQCQIRDDIKNRRTSGGGDAFYQSVVFVSLESVRVCVCIDVYAVRRLQLCMLSMPMTQALACACTETQPELLASATHRCSNIRHSVPHLPGNVLRNTVPIICYALVWTDQVCSGITGVTLMSRAPHSLCFGCIECPGFRL